MLPGAGGGYFRLLPYWWTNFTLRSIERANYYATCYFHPYEIDEEEIQLTDRTAYRRVAIYFYVQNSASTRTIVVNPTDLESALERDLSLESGEADATGN